MKLPRPFETSQQACDAFLPRLPKGRRKIRLVNVSEALAGSYGFLVLFNGKMLDADEEAWEPRILIDRSKYVTDKNPVGYGLGIFPVDKSSQDGG